MQSACSTDRIHSALATALPLVPGLAYFRFCALDPRCGIALDEIDPEQVLPQPASGYNFFLLCMQCACWRVRDAAKLQRALRCCPAVLERVLKVWPCSAKKLVAWHGLPT